jgi:hypothetical protein
MNRHRKRLMLAFGAAALLAAPRLASADASYNLRKAYTGSAGGDGNFGAGYRLEYGLSASKSSANTNVAGDAQASTWFKLFGKTFDAAAVKAKATGSVTSTCNANLAYETYLIGIKIPSASGSFAGGKFASKDLVRRSQQLTPKVSVDFLRVGPAVLGFEAFASATEYIRINGTAWCSHISAEIRPGAVLSATATFRLDALIVASGVRGTLALMDSAAPMAGTVSWLGRSQNDFIDGGSFCTWQLSSSATAKLEIVPVSGKFEPYVRVGLPCTDLFGLLPGKGICLNKEFSQVLWSASAGKSTFPLDGTPAEIRLGSNTPTCGPTIPAPPAR